MNHQLKEKQGEKEKARDAKEEGLQVLARGADLYKLIGLDFERVQGTPPSTIFTIKPKSLLVWRYV